MHDVLYLASVPCLLHFVKKNKLNPSFLLLYPWLLIINSVYWLSRIWHFSFICLKIGLENLQTVLGDSLCLLLTYKIFTRRMAWFLPTLRRLECSPKLMKLPFQRFFILAIVVSIKTVLQYLEWTQSRYNAHTCKCQAFGGIFKRVVNQCEKIICMLLVTSNSIWKIEIKLT